MKTQYATPVFVDAEGKSNPLSKVSLTQSSDSGGYTEEWLQTLLFDNPQSLPVGEIDSGYLDLVPVCTELNTPAGPLDILYVTPQGKLVILEAKLWRNPEARRKVIGQILDYAKELNAWDYEELQKQVSKRLKRSGNVLFELVSKAHPRIDEAIFVDEVSRSLATGKFMLLIVGDGIREGASAIAEFLDNVGHLQFSLGLVEVGIYQAGEGLFIQPRVLARTVIVNRTVIEVNGAGIQIQSDRDESDNRSPSAQGASNRDPFYFEFWSEFIKRLQLDDVSQKIPSPGRAQNQWFRIVPGSTEHAWINAYFMQSQNRVGVYFRVKDSPVGELILEQLERDRDSIMAELPEGSIWDISGDMKSVGTRFSVDDIKAPDQRERMLEFFTVTVNAYINAFRTRVERILDQIEL